MSSSRDCSEKKRVLENKPFVRKVKTLFHLSSSVINLECAYEDVAEEIEDLAYFECEKRSIHSVVEQLQKISMFFESMENKNDENCRDLAQVYLLIGQLYQYAGMFDESIMWFKRSVIVDDQFASPYHSLFSSFMHINDTEMAIRCLQQEILVAPGNYYSHLLLADLYEKNSDGESLERCLKNLLERDPDNIQGLHRLIGFYEKGKTVSVDLLRSRLLNRNGNFSRVESIIRAYHLSCANRFNDALDFLNTWSEKSPEVTIVHLAKAYLFDRLALYSKKRLELAIFKKKNNANAEVIATKLQEFEAVFGSKAGSRLKQRLVVSHPMSN